MFEWVKCAKGVGVFGCVGIIVLASASASASACAVAIYRKQFR